MQSTTTVIIVAIASFLGVTLLLFCLFCICQQLRSKSQISRQRRTRHRDLDLNLTSITADESASFDPSLSISMAELKTATRNFSKELIVGDGSFGLVYKAQLSSGVTVAIKKLNQDAFQGFREFRAEMETLGRLRHRNIVKILGYCISGSERLLIYEFADRGSLDHCLYEMSMSSETDVGGFLPLRLPLPWETRIKIVRGVAHGLSYLHGLDKPIIHRDIKASNVLLDSEFEPHIADFGLARMMESSNSHVSTQFAGTMGYMPPEYRDGVTVATPKADVYSFGVLMLEVAMGQRPNWPKVLNGRDVGLMEWARYLVAQNREMEMVEASISREGLMEGSVKEYFRIACLCTNEIQKKRPEMLTVVELLDRLYDGVCQKVRPVSLDAKIHMDDEQHFD